MRSAGASGRRGPPAARRILPSDDDDDCIVLTDSPVNNTHNRAGPSRPSAGVGGSGREFMSSAAAAAAERRAARRRPRTVFSSDDEDDTENQPPARRGRSTGDPDQHDVKRIQEEADAALARRLQEEEERQREHLAESTLTADEIAAILGESPEPVRGGGGRWQEEGRGARERHRHRNESSDSEDDSFDDVMAARVDTDDDEDILDLTGVGGLLNGSNLTSTPGGMGRPRRHRRFIHRDTHGPAIPADTGHGAVAMRVGGGRQRSAVVNVARRGRGGMGGARAGGRMLPGGYHGADGESDADTDEMEEDMDPANNEYLLDSFLVEGSDDESLLRRDSEEERDEDEEEDSDDYDDPDDEEAAVRRGAPYVVVNGVRFVLGYGDRSTHRLLPGDVLERVRGCVPIKSRGRITGYKVGVAPLDGSIPREMVVDEPGPSGSGARATTAGGRRPRGEVGRQRRSSLPPMGNWGECTICFDKEMDDPVGCQLCRQLVGCRKCVNTWFSMCGTVGSASVHAHRSCPLCRQSWGPTAPKVERMDVLARNTSSR